MALRRLLAAAFFATAAAQPSYTLPPPCPLAKWAPGDAAPAFTLRLTNGSELALPGPRNSHLLPLILFVVDAERDPGGVLLATDPPELDRLFASEPPARGTIVLLTASPAGGGGAGLEERIAARLALQPKELQDGWRARLAFSAQTLDELRSVGSALPLVLDGWQQPRLLVRPAPPDTFSAPRVDGRYECFPWPDVTKDYPVRGPFTACDPHGCPIDIPDGALLLLLNATADGGACSAEAATAWAMSRVPQAAGAIIGAPAPAVVGREESSCPSRSFYPMVVSDFDSLQLAKRVEDGGLKVQLTANYSCEAGTWLGITSGGALATVGWRKYNAIFALRWALDHVQYLDETRASAEEASFAIELVPPRSPINAFSADVTLTPRALREAYRAQLDFEFACPGVGDADCGPWDRIVSAKAACWPSAAPPQPLPAPLEIARYITPYRKAAGRWLTSADALLGMVGNGTVGGSFSQLDEPWTCRIAMESCCEPWLGTLTLRLFDPLAVAKGAPEPPVPFAVIPLAFPNSNTHFGPGYNANRTMAFTPPAGWRRAALSVIISGHGADAPPPQGQGCEFAPTSHAFALGPAASFPAGAMVANTSEAAYDQFMRASTQFGCADKVVGLGAMAGQHGAWLAGRDGWCPGQVVWPVTWDVTAALQAGGSHFLTYSALSYWVDLSHATEDGCGGDIQFSGALIFYEA